MSCCTFKYTIFICQVYFNKSGKIKWHLAKKVVKMNFNINRYYTYDKAFMAKIGNEQIDYETGEISDTDQCEFDKLWKVHIEY